MYDDTDSIFEPPEILEDLDLPEVIRAHSPGFWDADSGELVGADPFEHPSWDVHEALTEGWEDPEEAALLLEQTVIEDARLVPLADTPTRRLEPTPLVLVPAAPDGTWPADDGDYDREVAA